MLSSTILVAILSLPQSAAPGSITGRVIETRSHTGLAAVEVVVRRASDSTVVAHTASQEDGRFRLDTLPLDHYLLRASLLGYVPLTRSDIVLAEGAPSLDLGEQPLTVAPLSLPGVTTTTERATAIIAADRNIYLTKDMPAAANGTATDVLRAVPELDVDFDGKVSLRGGSSVTVQLNGRKAPMSGDALATLLRQFPAQRIERIEVIANPSAKFDPEGMSGIVNIVLKDNATLGLSGSVWASGGPRSTNSGTRLAWQSGPWTLFSGVNGYWSNSESRFEDARDNLLARPLTHYRLQSGSDNHNGFGSFDASLEAALNKRATLYGTLNGYVNSYEWSSLSAYALLDSALAATSRYDRTSDGSSTGRTGTATLGFRHMIQQDRNERSIELRQNDSDNHSSNDAFKHVIVPADSAGVADQRSRQPGETGSHERSIEADDSHPLGEHGKLELGYRGWDRRSTSTSALEFLAGDVVVVTPQSSASDYLHHEIFNSGYVTAGSTFGRLSVQAGVRGEQANTSFDVLSAGTHYGNDYSSVFPSGNLAWDFGKGRTSRFTYSKRIERPSAAYLNPDVPVIDPLNRTAGNPYLKPKYTHSFGFEASWMGSRGSLRWSPYFRRTINNWDQFKTVDSMGVALTTWRNASSIRYAGASLSASLRQVKRWGGTASVSVWRETHDASNFAASGLRQATNWSANTNLTFKATKALDLQGSLRYTPAQTLAQGKLSAITYSNLGARLKLGEKAWINLYLNDPFNLWKYSLITRDASHVQTSTNHYTIRTVSLGLTWTWGKPPEQKQRRTSSESPSTEPSIQVH